MLRVKKGNFMFIRFLPTITLFFLPLYLIRFNIAGVSVNVLMLWVMGLLLGFGAWLFFEKKIQDFWDFSRKSSVWLLSLVVIFFLASLLSIFVGGVNVEKNGQFIVLFAQPILVFFVFRYIFEKIPSSKELFEKAGLYFVGVCGLLAVIQYFTLWTLPEIYRGNPVEPKRALAIFEYPNAYALFVAPLLAFLLPRILENLNGLRKKVSVGFDLALYFFGVVGLFFSLSRGGWLAFLFSLLIGVFALGKAWVKMFFGVLILVFIAAVVLNPTFKERINAPFSGENSSIYRIYMAKTSWNMIKAQPFSGMGLLGYGNNYSEYKFDSKLEHYKYPHNLLLTLWVELGILGVIGFFGLVLYFVLRAFQKESGTRAMAVGLFLFALLVHGLVDVPYFKNDLALLFWLVLAI